MVNFAAPIREVWENKSLKMVGKEFNIPFVGLKLGVHEFEFEINDAFFESIEYSLIQKGNVKIVFELEKKETMMIGNYSIEGLVHTACDRCTGPLEVFIDGEYQLVYKFADEPEEDESLVVVYPEEFEINIKDSIHEFITVSLPPRVVHDEDECDEEMMSLLDEYVVNSMEYDEDDDEFEFDDEDEENDEEEEETEGDSEYVDPRWEALRKLKGDKEE